MKKEVKKNIGEDRVWATPMVYGLVGVAWVQIARVVSSSYISSDIFVQNYFLH